MVLLFLWHVIVWADLNKKYVDAVEEEDIDQKRVITRSAIKNGSMFGNVQLFKYKCQYMGDLDQLSFVLEMKSAFIYMH